jgi:hypothetical protein
MKPATASAPTAAAHRAPAPIKLLGGPGVWTKFSNGTVSGFAQVALLRTADGELHAVWVKTTGANKYSVASTTFSLTGALLHNGVAIQNWYSLEQTLALVPDGKNIRLIFNGGQDLNNSNKFSAGARYTATSTNGLSWALVNGSLSSHTVLNQPIAATTEADGTPVSAEGLNSTIFYHVGVDPSVPAAIPDQQLTHGSAYSLGNNTLVRGKDGSIYIGWYEGSNTAAGYWVQKILPSKGAPMLAPHSKDVNLPDNEPFGPVALAARVGGGVYLAYCQPSKSEQCAQIDLWKVGTKTVRVVPGSTSGAPIHVTLSAGAKGRLVVAWFDKTNSVIRVVRTNTHATAWGVIRTVAPPVKASNLASFDGLFAESSSGRIDLVADVQQFSNNAPVALYHTQVLEGLKVTASPTKVSHLHTTTVTFTVTDAGEAVAGATVSFDGHTAHTTSKGVAKISVKKGQKKGSKTATASKTGYYKGVVTVKID